MASNATFVQKEIGPSLSSASEGELKAGSLSTRSIVFMVIAAAAPLTVVGADVPIGMSTGNGVGYPAMYGICAVILALFSVGLCAMSKHLSEPGAFFSYVEAAFGRRMGMGTAYLALLTYTSIQFGVYGYLGQSISLLFSPVVSAPWWVYTLVIALVIGYLGYHNIELSSQALGVLLIAEIAIVVVMDIVIIVTGGEHGLDLAPFTPEQVFSGAPGVGLMLALAGFIGFESTTVFRAEAKDPDRTVPRATYISVAVIGIFYTISGWAVVQGWGSDQALAVAEENPETMVIMTAQRYLGSWSGPAVHILLLTSLFACVLSFHNVLTRYQHAISCKRGLPRSLRAIHLTYQSPHMSSFVQTGTVLVLTILSTIFHLDPVVHIFTWLAGLATYTIVILMLLVSVSVIVFFWGKTDIKESRWSRLWAPTLSFLGLSVAMYYVLTNFILLVEGSGLIATVLGFSAPVVFTVGVVCSTFVPEFDDKIITKNMEKRMRAEAQKTKI